ncbi:PAS domain S-box protein [Telmatospirillum sp.]|uniref:PAS domain S-box protein n=1 Tax=Telmatospirillum sp. TaxID=2079197 RepID=UPI00284DAE8F|nr:PAS domain S-box protein [Telmatospirillum sp.]MDR3439112.1 PAS domain S-box protein [Telmatospirillum sp.]
MTAPSRFKRVDKLTLRSNLPRSLAGVLLLNLFVFGLVGFVLFRGYQQDRDETMTVVENLSRVLDENLSRLIDKVDLTLLAVVDEIAREEQNGGIDRPVLERFLALHDSRLPEAVGLRVINADGVVDYAVSNVSAPDRTVADRDYFTRLRDDPSAGLVISKPMVGRLSHRPILVLARRRTAPDGSFAGVVHVAVAIDTLSATFSAADLGPHGAVTLWDGSATPAFLARYSRVPSPTAGIPTPSAALSDLIRKAAAPIAYHAKSGVDGIDRLSFFRKVSRWPLYLTVGIADEDFMAEWWQEVTYLGCLAVLFMLASIAASAKIYRTLWALERSQNEAQSARKMSDLILASAGEGICGIDATGEIVFINQAARQMLGWRNDEGLGELFHTAVQHHRWNGAGYALEDSPVHRMLLGQLPAGTVRVEDEVYWRRDGRSFPVAYALTPMHGDTGETTGIVCIFHDITERKKAETLLKESETRLRLALNAAHQGWFEVNFRTGEVTTSPEYVELLGYDPADFQSNLEKWRTNIYADDRPAVVTALQEALETGEKREMEYRRLAKSGDWKWIRSIARVVEWDAEGKPLRMTGIHMDVTERRQAEEALRDSEERFRLAMEASSDGLWDWDVANDSTYFSPAYFRMLGFEPDEFAMTGETWIALIHPEDRQRAVSINQDCIENRCQNFEVEYRMRAKDGSWKWILGRGRAFRRDLEGQALRMIGTHVDITERKQAEAYLQLAANVFTHSHEGITITDADGTIIEVNDAFTRITGYRREEAVGKTPRILHSGRQPREFYKAMWQALVEKGHWSGEIWNRHKNGDVYAEMLTVSAVRDAAGKTQNYVGLFTDITAMKEHEQQLEHIAHYDVLTNLPNRVLLADRLRHGLAQGHRRGRSLAVAYLDLDGFKVVNDRYGHDIGDELLTTISQRMKAALRDGDTLARIGGDEFVALLVDLERPQDCKAVLDRLLEASSDPVTVGDLILEVSSSIGVTLYPDDGVDADLLLRHADQAMYVAKLAGKNRYHVFDVAQDAAVKTQRESLEHIRRALDRREFVLYYQPKVNMRTGRVIGAEALIRWQHPDRGLLLPAAFLPIIEDHLICVELGDWVIDTALTQMELWHQAGIDLPTSVNVSARQLQDRDFVARLRDVLAAHPGVRPDFLELEILETSALEDIALVSEILQACRTIGVHFALDDFGIGYSSLNHLRHLPIEMVKIDQSFVRDMLIDREDRLIVEGVVGLAKAFERRVIAEGVETVTHGDVLLSLGCELAQGCGIAEPMPAADLPGWIATWRPDRSWTDEGETLS